MRKLIVLALGVSIAVVLGASSSASADYGGAPHQDGGHGHWFRQTCDAPGHGVAACGVQVVTNSAGVPLASASPPAGAYGPAQFHGGYALPTAAPGTQTIGIVDAYNDPTIESDLAAYDAQYGLTCDGCFTKVDQKGGTAYPATDKGWSLEIALDVETAHQICQNCHILLVEANSASMTDLGAAVNEAVALGANVVSNSYGSREYSSETSDENAYFNHPGVAITVSSGDGGYGVEFPAASRYVTAVGGTTLSLNSNNTWHSEAAWSGAGSGCSAYEPKPSWQTDPSCSRRTVADVSADADPNTGAAIFDTQTSGTGSWYQVGGTSLSSPLIAAVYALTGNAAAANYGSTPYSHTASLHDVASGHNGSCRGSYLCTSVTGFDGPTGLGTPNGLVGFGATTAPSGDFSVGVGTPSVTVTQGTPAAYNVSVSTSGGFASSVALTQSPLPNGTFSPSSLPSGSGTSTLTVATSAIAAGTYPFQITGTGGGKTHSVAATLVVQAAPDFTISVSPTSQTIARTGTSSYTVTIGQKSGFAGLVTLSATGFVSGLTGAFVPSQIQTSGTSTFTVTASNVRRKTHITLTITGTSGALSHSTTLALTTTN